MGIILSESEGTGETALLFVQTLLLYSFRLYFSIRSDSTFLFADLD